MDFNEIVVSALNKAIENSNLDLKCWWKYDFETEVAIESEADLTSGEFSADDIEDNKNDFICDIIGGFESEVRQLLDIQNCINKTEYAEKLFELIHDIIHDELQRIMFSL